jgi:hypothetical protein
MNERQHSPQNSVYESIKRDLEALSKKNVPELEMNEIRKILKKLNVEEFPGKGSSIKFYHSVLEGIPPYTAGVFQIHIVHKGGNKQLVQRVFFKKYMYPTLLEIIRLLETPK